ncbi:photosystem II manganese-stabilizing polypeptide [Pleurocapsales cyanobacterium LEGE 06147]|nr:photosystem II manganese-stabilizing polypeptide [Pleurocapsales cyanobacterium LEGE 06147]
MRYRAFIAAFLALCLGVLTACSAGPTAATTEQLTYEKIQQRSYDDVLGTGLANYCPQMPERARGSITLEPNTSYVIKDLCLEPTSFFVKEEPTSKRKEAEFVPGKVVTPGNVKLDQVSGQLKVNEDGSLTFIEEDGFDFQAITVQLPGGEQVPFLFTIKELVATTRPGLKSVNASIDFEGEFNVPSYRGAGFLDPKGRGAATGYDNAVALPSQADDEEYIRANLKRTDSDKGKIVLNVTKVDGATGEIAGVFESEQTSDTDLGADEPKEVKIRGIFYGRVEPKV